MAATATATSTTPAGHMPQTSTLQMTSGNSQSMTCGKTGCAKTFQRTPFPDEHCVVVSKDVSEWITGKKELRKPEVHNLLKMVNSLLNSGGGVMYIHVETEDLNQLDEQLDDMLMKLITDGTSFSQNYDRKLDLDGKHVTLRVIARDRPLSTLDFKTKSSTNKGLRDLHHHEMQTTLRQLLEPQDNQHQHISPIDGTALKSGRTLDKFHENTYTEAKSVEHNVPTPTKTDGLKLVDYAWTKLKLPERITSFSKEAKGGYYFLGIGEAKIPALPPLKGCTRKFVCEGVPLSNDQHRKEHDNFRKHLQHKINTEMLWCRGLDMKIVEPKDIEGQATVKFRGLEQSSLYIIEVMVKTFFGLCFTDPEGPEAYEFKHPSNPTKSHPWRIPFGDWLKHQPSLVDVAAGV